MMGPVAVVVVGPGSSTDGLSRAGRRVEVVPLYRGVGRRAMTPGLKLG